MATKAKNKVIIIGGGIAGLTTAHLLIMSGCDVTLIECSDDVGGQAKSGYYNGNFPTEHSLRVIHDSYAHFYKIFKILQEHSYLNSDYNLSQLDLCALYSDFSFYFKKNKLGKIGLLQKLTTHLKMISYMLRKGVKIREIILIIKLVYLMDDSLKSLIKKYDLISIEELLRLNDCSKIFYNTVYKIAQICGAVKPGSSSVLALRLLKIGREMIGDIHSVKMFNGPNSAALFHPWRKCLHDLGVNIFTQKKITMLNSHEGHIVDCLSEDNCTFSGDYYVLATDYHNAKSILSNSNLLNSVNLDTKILDRCFEWSNGAQFYFSKLPEATHYNYPGLVTVYLESPWSLVSVLQSPPFWSNLAKVNPSIYTLSVTFTNATAKGVVYQKTLLECTPNEIKQELLSQCGILQSDSMLGWHLDDSLQYVVNTAPANFNEKLPMGSFSQQLNNVLINHNMLFTPVPGYYRSAPGAVTNIRNLYFAGEYCDTSYEIPTMEKACESGFHAANSILKKLNLPTF